MFGGIKALSAVQPDFLFSVYLGLVLTPIIKSLPDFVFENPWF